MWELFTTNSEVKANEFIESHKDSYIIVMIHIANIKYAFEYKLKEHISLSEKWIFNM